MTPTIDWTAITTTLDHQGWAILPALLSQTQCTETEALYADPSRFRKHVVMGRHGYGEGEYRYFAYDLPPLVAHLRQTLYASLAPLANRWHERLGLETRFPATHADFIANCHQAGQTKPTPLLLQYRAGDYNCLHQDIYGPHIFPLQVATLLSTPGTDFEGGEFILTEQRPRMQSRAAVVPLGRGDAVVFAVNTRPVHGTKRDHRVILRHGVSTIRTGHRATLGIIFHDAA